MPNQGPTGDGFIVVVGQWREGQGHAPTPYAVAIRGAGGTPVIFSVFDLPDKQIPEGVEFHELLEPDDASVLDGASGLLLPGGGDIDPARYGQARHEQTDHINERRDAFERTLLGRALEADMPVLAICHGMQLLNVELGGTLDQHLMDIPTRIDHDRGYPTPDPIHGMRVKERSLLAAALGVPKLEVNSHHHQGLGRVAEPLEEVAWADDGVLEGVVSTAHSWVVGVQWHPEVMTGDDNQLNLFRAFVEATRAFQEREAREAS